MKARALVTNLLATTLACALGISACGGSSSPGGHASTQFLGDCGGGCPGDMICACGLCTLLCQNDAACMRFADSARCASLINGSCRVQETVCDLPCTDALDCSAAGPDFMCNEGACR